MPTIVDVMTMVTITKITVFFIRSRGGPRSLLASANQYRTAAIIIIIIVITTSAILIVITVTIVAIVASNHPKKHPTETQAAASMTITFMQ